jgi:hypothetical protein
MSFVGEKQTFARYIEEAPRLTLLPDERCIAPGEWRG